MSDLRESMSAGVAPARAELAARVLAAADAFVRACPAVTARRCFRGFPRAIEDAYADLWEATLDYEQSAPFLAREDRR